MFYQCDIISVKQENHRIFIKKLKNIYYCSIHHLVFEEYIRLKFKCVVIKYTFLNQLYYMRLIIHFIIVNYICGIVTHVQNIFVFV